MVTEFFVPGKAAPQGSKRHVGGGRMIESAKRLKPWRETVAAKAREVSGEMIDGPVILGLAFIMTRPKATPKYKPTPAAVKRPDIEKLARAVSDALTGINFRDDSQVVAMPLSKRIAALDEEPGVVIYVSPLTTAGLVYISEEVYWDIARYTYPPTVRVNERN